MEGGKTHMAENSQKEYETAQQTAGAVPLFAAVASNKGSSDKTADKDAKGIWAGISEYLTSAQTEEATSNGAEVPVTPAVKKLVVIERITPEPGCRGDIQSMSPVRTKTKPTPYFCTIQQVVPVF